MLALRDWPESKPDSQQDFIEPNILSMAEPEPDPIDPTPRAAATRPRGWRLKSLVLGALLGVAIIVTALFAIAFIVREKLPRLTEADYDAAVARWQRNKPANYDLDLDVLGNRASKIHVEVRGGEVAHMIRDGVEPRQKRTWDYWSVDGQLDTIGQEMEMAKNPSKSFVVRGASEMVMWAEFDARFGYPRRYRRVVLGADFEVDWTVTRFEIVPEHPNAQ